jgi:hypothetical protein
VNFVPLYELFAVLNNIVNFPIAKLSNLTYLHDVCEMTASIRPCFSAPSISEATEHILTAFYLEAPTISSHET